MGRIIKIAIVIVAIFAAVNAGSAQWAHMEFKDAIRQLAEFGADQGDDALRAAVLAEAARRGILLEPKRVGITRSTDHIYLDITYTRPVQVLPGYLYNWAFEIKIDRWFIPGSRIR